MLAEKDDDDISVDSASSAADSEDHYQDACDEDEGEAEMEAKRLEIVSMLENFGVGTFVSEHERHEQGLAVLKAKWVKRVQIGKEGQKSVRMRIVGKEFSAMAPSRRGLFTASCATSTSRVLDLFSANGDIYTLVGDATNAYFQIEETEPICIELDNIPELKAFAPPGAGYLKLLKKLYGRRDASAKFGEALAAHAIEMGAERCLVQPSMYFFRKHGVKMEIHQDDFRAVCASRDGLEELKDGISLRFVFKYSVIMGIPSHYRHMNCDRYVTHDGIFIIADEKYQNDAINKLGLCRANPVATPITTTRSPDDGPELDAHDTHVYRSVVGSLRYLRAFRPDLGFAVKELSHGLKTPTEQDWVRLKRVGRYLHGTPQTCIFFPRGQSVRGPITATSDSDSVSYTHLTLPTILLV